MQGWEEQQLEVFADEILSEQKEDLLLCLVFKAHKGCTQLRE